MQLFSFNLEFICIRAFKLHSSYWAHALCFDTF